MHAMDVMAACRRHGQDIKRLEERIEELEEAVTGCTAAPGSGVHGAATDRMSAYAARRDELEERLKAARKAWAAEQMTVILLTDSMQDLPRRCLRRFYCDGESAAAIADGLNYSVSSIFKALSAARQEAAAIPPETVDEKLPVWYLKTYREEEQA